MIHDMIGEHALKSDTAGVRVQVFPSASRVHYGEDRMKTGFVVNGVIVGDLYNPPLSAKADCFQLTAHIFHIITPNPKSLLSTSRL